MIPASKGHWQLWIDTGGTFTDCMAVDPAGAIRRLKILSNSVLRGKVKSQPNSFELEVEIAWPLREDIFTGFEIRIVGTSFSSRIARVETETSRIFLKNPIKKKCTEHTFEISSNEEVPVLAARLLTATPLGKKFPPLELKLGSTRGTNAILERKGADTVFLVTKGFKDLLLIGNQQRRDLFTTNVIKSVPLYKTVIEIDERTAADGTILSPLALSSLDEVIAQLKRKKIQSIGIALLNSYKNPAHELELTRTLRSAGFKFISASHELSPQIKLLSRAETSIANAYLDPIIHTYLAGIQKVLAGARLKVMTSGGSLVASGSFFPKDSLLSGPAGGVVGAVRQAARSGAGKIIAFDMGGTSTDVSLYKNRYEYRFESRVGDFRILAPSLAIETIAAGGGSICDFDGHRFTVGPKSAGASPGPACYGAGGPLTITDVNVLLGRLDPENFAIPIEPKKSREAFDGLLKKVRKATGKKISSKAALESLIQIANEKMADAVKKISVQQGHDPREFTLLSFGGAGGQHACALAHMLQMDRVIVPYDAGLLSASGIGHAPIEKFKEKQILIRWKTFAPQFKNVIQQLFDLAKADLVSDGHDESLIGWQQTLMFLRFEGQDSPLEIEYRDGDDIQKLFRKKYEAIFGHWTQREVEVESLRVIAAVQQPDEELSASKGRAYHPGAARTLNMTSAGKKEKGKVYRWEDLIPGAVISGPALVTSGNSTTFIERGWAWRLDDQNNAHLHLSKRSKKISTPPAEAQLELFTNRFTAIAQEMGALLQRTSFSVNVKERLDFSCAVLDRNGYLVVNAPHIPVHLGSMGVCVREVSKVIQMNEGDVVITNHPAFGGSHLPDVTLIKPVFHKKALVGFVANRAHHAEIGGSKPGSMPADARSLAEEGVIIKPAYLVRKGEARWDEIADLFKGGPFPTRALEENLADLNGALAALTLGERSLVELCDLYGQSEVVRQMNNLKKFAGLLLRDRIKTLPARTYKATEYLDDGSPLQVKIQKVSGGLRIDFTGSSAIHPRNLNATPAIVQSVVLYGLRLLVDQPLPMNEGLMEHVETILPMGLLNPDFRGTGPAVVGGNTEVSQRLTDVLLKAMGLAACSQGTMNNLLFGNQKFGYYETICGGTGAGPGFDGADAVHQHMTNTRITDPELMEFRYPVRLVRFEIRKGSGGKGKWSGGNGVEREILFLEDLEVNILSQHRKERPYGLSGGGAGKVGEQMIINKHGEVKTLAGMDSASVKPGDRLIIKTPGGGGYGGM